MLVRRPEWSTPCNASFGAFGVAAVSAVFAANGSFGTAASVDAGFRPAMMASAVLCILGAGFALVVKTRKRLPAGALNNAPPVPGTATHIPAAVQPQQAESARIS
jgi:hypothetical protein